MVDPEIKIRLSQVEAQSFIMIFLQYKALNKTWTIPVNKTTGKHEDQRGTILIRIQVTFL